ncbi:flagellar biosynthesis protein FlhB [Endozoicomonas sp. 4G]|uniref:flagellar biosynthesis protein FlhB n=1 Tax=Endozoicomonas sp. 4G TaxID=2872754 RepID=UPI00207850BE|nr:flagellar biosynthesis protein FlhB [Endozoicomonas sp. 4G]
MAEQPDSGERSEEPSERKLQKSRDEGQVPRSRELVTFALLASTLGALWVSGGLIRDRLVQVMHKSFSFEKDALRQESWLTEHLAISMTQGFSGLMPFALFVILASIAASAALGGWIFSNKQLQPKAERISFFKGIKRMFSANSMIELLKSIAKILLLSFSLWLIHQWFFREMLWLNRLPIIQAISEGLHHAAMAFAILVTALLLICFIDVPFQRWNHIKKLRMTHKEMRDEMKEAEGQPELRSKLREKQQEIAGRRMMQAVPSADVIITNPTHFAVALKYDLDKARAPYVVAKGVDRVALRICAVAREYNKPVVQSPTLTRVIYYTTQLNQEIADDLFLAVAQVLAYVHHLNDFQAGRKSKAPDLPTPEVPRAFREKWDKKAQ